MPIEIVDLYESLRRGVIDGAYIPLETLKGFKMGEVQKYTTASWKVGSVYAFYVVMNKNKWNSSSSGCPEDDYRFLQGIHRKMGSGVEQHRYRRQGVFHRNWAEQIIPLSDAEGARWVKAVEPVVEDFKKDLVSKGYKAEEVDGWLKFVKERIEYWKGQEKAKKVATAYKY